MQSGAYKLSDLTVTNAPVAGRVLTALNEDTLEWRDVNPVDALTAAKLREFTPVITTGSVITTNPQVNVKLKCDASVDRVINLPDADTNLIGQDTPDYLMNKNLTDASNTISANLLNGVKLTGAQPQKGDVLVASDAASAVWAKPIFLDDATIIKDSVDTSITLRFDVSGASGTQTILRSGQTCNRTITLPDADDVLATQNSRETLSNKTLVNATCETISVGSNVLKLPLTGSELVSDSAPATLSNKTLADPTIERIIVAGGNVLTLPNNKSDIIVARDSSDILTNKVLVHESNVVAANMLKTKDNFAVDLTTSEPPKQGQSLVATSPSNAEWKWVTCDVLADNFSVASAEGGQLRLTPNSQKTNIASNPEQKSSTSIILPAESGVLITQNGCEILSNKTLDQPVISSLKSSREASLLKLPTLQNDDFLVSCTSESKLLNKTLASPKIDKIMVADGTAALALPQQNDRLLGANAPDEVKNKIITDVSNVVSATMLRGVELDATPPKQGQLLVVSQDGKAVWRDIADLGGAIKNALPPSEQAALPVFPDTLENKIIINPNILVAGTRIILPQTDAVQHLTSVNSKDALLNKDLTDSSNNVIANALRAPSGKVLTLPASEAKSGDILRVASDGTLQWAELPESAKPVVELAPPVEVLAPKPEQLAVKYDGSALNKVTFISEGRDSNIYFPAGVDCYFPSGEIITSLANQELSGKTLTDKSNNIAANKLRFGQGAVVELADLRDAPEEGNVLAIDAEGKAKWVDPARKSSEVQNLSFVVGSGRTTLISTNASATHTLQLPAIDDILVTKSSEDKLENKTLVAPYINTLRSTVGADELRVPFEGTKILTDASHADITNKVLRSATNDIVANALWCNDFASGDKPAQISLQLPDLMPDSKNKYLKLDADGALRWSEHKLDCANSTIVAGEASLNFALGEKGKTTILAADADETLLKLPATSGTLALAEEITVAANRVMAAIPPRQKIKAGEGIICEESGLETKIHRYESFVSLIKTKDDNDDLYALHSKSDSYEIINSASGTIRMYLPKIKHDKPDPLYAKPGDTLRLVVSAKSKYGVNFGQYIISPGSAISLIANMDIWVPFATHSSRSAAIRDDKGNVTYGSDITLNSNVEKSLAIGSMVSLSGTQSATKFGSVAIGYSVNASSETGGAVVVGSNSKAIDRGVALGTNAFANNVLQCGVPPAIKKCMFETDEDAHVELSSAVALLSCNNITHYTTKKINVPSPNHLVFPKWIEIINTGLVMATIKLSIGDFNQKARYLQSYEATVSPKSCSRVELGSLNLHAVDEYLAIEVEEVQNAGTFRVVIAATIIEN